MTGYVDVVEQALLNHFLTDPAYTPPTTMYLGVSSTTPADDGTNFTEPTTGDYARVATTAADWGAATGTAPATKANTATLTLPTATADWLAGADLTHWGLFDAETEGNLLFSGELDTSKPVLSGDTPSFGSGALVMKLGDPTDTY